MSVVANVNAEIDIGCLKNREATVAGFEKELLKKPGVDLRDVRLAILAKVGAVCINYCSRVEVNARYCLLIYRYDNNHVVFFRILLHQLRGWAFRDLFCRGIPLSILAGTEIGLRKYFLKTQHLNSLFAGVMNKGFVGLQHDVPILVG